MTLDIRKAVSAGLIAGVVFVIVEMLLVATVGGGSPWGPPRMMAAIVMGKEVLPPPPTFDLMIMMVGMIVHFVLSIVLALIFGAVMASKADNKGVMIVAGIVFGLIVYAINFYGFTAIFPWFANARNAITIFAHAIFGLTLGLLYAKGSSEAQPVG